MTPKNEPAAREGSGRTSPHFKRFRERPNNITRSSLAAGGRVGVLLDRLDGVRQTGADRWLARCPAHEDRHPSLSVRDLDDGRVLLHCFANCAAGDVLAAVGLTFADLFPERLGGAEGMKRTRRPFFASDILRAIAHEARIVWIAALDIGHDRAISDSDRERLVLAGERIADALEVAHGR